MTGPHPAEERPAVLSRRRLLGWFSVGTAGAVAAGAAHGLIEPDAGGPQAAADAPTAQDRLHFVAFDLVTGSRDALVELLQAWTAAARRVTAGEDAGRVGAVDGAPHAPPDDTGEAVGLPPSGLTLTIGFGRTLLVADDGTDRFGLAAQRPGPLVDLPVFPGDALD